MGKNKNKSLTKSLGIDDDDLIGYLNDRPLLLESEHDEHAIINSLAIDVKRQILAGTMDVYDLAYYRHELLRKIMTYHKIPNRSLYTTKYSMAERIVTFFKYEREIRDGNMFKAFVESVPDTDKNVVEFVRKYIN